jgi:hypothetical protein
MRACAASIRRQPMTAMQIIIITILLRKKFMQLDEDSRVMSH